MAILSSNISVIVQGPIHHQESLTKRVLESVRTHLPNAELILSTWKGSDVSGLDCDVLLLNDDPGAIIRNNNVNRQIVSTRNGLQKASRHYAMKLRTDTLLTGTGFLDVFDRCPERREDFKVFQHKIVIPTLYTRNPFRVSVYSRNTYFFHPSDIFQFGLTNDLILLWDIPLATFENRLFPEQYVWTSCLKSSVENIDYFNLTLPKMCKIHEVSLVNNFIVETPTHLGIVLPEPLCQRYFISACYSPDELERSYHRYIINRSNFLPISNLIFQYLSFSLASLELSLGIKRMIMKFYERRNEKELV